MRKLFHEFAGRTVSALSAVAVMVCLSMTAQSAPSGTVILEGSDAIGFHCSLGDAAACLYQNQVWSAIGASDPRKIAVVGTPASAAIGSGTHPVIDFPTLSTAGALSNYVALYFLAGSGCCLSDPSDLGGRNSDVAAYLAAGGTVMIENYDGNTGWDFIVGAGGTGNAHVAGFGGGLGGFTCNDGETVTALGTTNGFTQPPPISCWTHQAYDPAFFGPLGFTKSFFNSPTGVGVDGFSSLLSSGSTVTVTQSPEPASIALLVTALTGIGVIRRRRR